MASLDDQLNAFEQMAEKRVNLTNEQKSRINQAGAKVYENVLKEATRKHISTRKRPSHGVHLVDDIKTDDKNADGIKDGSWVVGFGKKDYIARFLNDGTIYIKGDHFVDHAIEQARKQVQQAQLKEYQRIVKEH